MNRIIEGNVTQEDMNRLKGFFKASEITEKLKDDFFEKWRNEVLFPLCAKNNLEKPPYLMIINSDVVASGSYLDSMYCDLLYGELSKRHENSKKIQTDRYIAHSHIFTQFIIVRSIILNTAYINAYYNIKNDVFEYNQDPFDYLNDRKNPNAKDCDNLIDAFNGNINYHMIKIFDLQMGDKISILSQYKDKIKEVLDKRGINTVKNVITDLSLIKLLEENLTSVAPDLLKDAELETLFELSSKSFHRHEVLLFWINRLCNDRFKKQPNDIDQIINNTIIRLVKVSTLLYGYQINLINKLLDENDTDIINDFPKLMQL